MGVAESARLHRSLVPLWTEQAFQRSSQHAPWKFLFVPATDSQSDKTGVQDPRDTARIVMTSYYVVRAIRLEQRTGMRN